jgi:hypothetical protein
MTRKVRIDGDKELLDDLGNYADVVNKTDAYTLVKLDAGALVNVAKGTGVAVTVPANIFDVGDRIDIVQGGAGAVTITAGASTTVNVDATFTKVTAGQWSVASVICIAANVFVVTGDLVAA